jgi:hypothetical protein
LKSKPQENEKKLKKCLTHGSISGILDELSLEDEFEKQLKKLFKKV